MDIERLNEEAFEGKDIVMEPVAEDTLKQCSRCKYSIGKAAACKKYTTKPGAVILGEAECTHFEE